MAYKNPEDKREADRKYRAENLNKVKEWNRSYYKKNHKALWERRKHDVAKINHKARWERRKHDVAKIKYGSKAVLPDYQTKCQVCLKTQSQLTNKKKKQKICIDHCHDSKVIRGYLCSRCNSALGMLDDGRDLVLLIRLYDYALAAKQKIELEKRERERTKAEYQAEIDAEKYL